MYAAVLLLAVSLHWVAPGTAYVNEPAGFRGMYWGTDVSSDPALRFSQAESDMGVPAGKGEPDPLHAYAKDKDDLMMGTAELSSVHYYFWRGKFFGAVAATRSMKTKDNLRDVCVERFGPPDKSESFVMPGVRHTWFGQYTTVYLEDMVWYWRVTIVSTEMARTREAYRALPPPPPPPDASRGF